MPLRDYICADGHKMVAVLVRLGHEKEDTPTICQAEVYDPATRTLEPPCGLLLSEVMAAPSQFPGADGWRR